MSEARSSQQKENGGQRDGFQANDKKPPVQVFILAGQSNMEGSLMGHIVEIRTQVRDVTAARGGCQDTSQNNQQDA